MNSTRPPEVDLPTAGDVVAGRYRVVSVIGTGGMGVVLGAVDMSLGRKVAIKFLAPHKAARPGATARFAREARAAAALHSEHVVRVFDAGTVPTGPGQGSPYIVMELLEGRDLAQTLLARGPLPIAEAVDYVLQACGAIGEAHARGIVHRDLKPQNLFLTRLANGSACIKVLDFGISKAVEEDATIITFADMVLGTPMYMSPEQMRSLKLVDWRSDIWALGAILFELLTASPIFDAETTAELCAMIMLGAPTPLRQLRPDAPAELEEVIVRCLHKDPSGRYSDVAELAWALAPFASLRGRLSASHVSCVVHPSVQQDAPLPRTGSLGFDTTSDVNDRTQVMASAPRRPISSFPPLSVSLPVPAPTGHVPRGGPTTGPVPSTQRSWLAPATEKVRGIAPVGRSMSALAAAVGLAVGVASLGLLGGGFVLYKRNSSKGQAAVPAVPKPNDDRLDAEKRVAQSQCSHMQSLLRSNDPKENLQAKQVRNLTCALASGPRGTTCDRASCRSACTTLKDEPCLLQLEKGERSFPARF